MNSRNRVQLIGNLGSDPVVREFENGNKAEFSVATNEVFTRKGEKVTETTWHKCIAWGKTADLISKFAKKGDEILVSGKIANRSYEDKDGTKKYITEVVVFEVIFRFKSEAA
jgi:single-strand DNA-binding protein